MILETVILSLTSIVLGSLWLADRVVTPKAPNVEKRRAALLADREKYILKLANAKWSWDRQDFKERIALIEKLLEKP